MLKHYKNLQVLTIFVLISKCDSFACPSLDMSCQCDYIKEMLKCPQGELLPPIENIKFKIIDLWDVKSDIPFYNNVSCDHLLIKGQLNSFTALKPLMDITFEQLTLNDMETTFIYRLLEKQSETLTKLIMTEYKPDQLNLVFDNFPNLKSIRIGGNGNFNVLRKIGSGIFSKLEFLEELDLSYAGIESIEENGLMFSSKRYIQIHLNNNAINLNEFVKSNLSNSNGFNITLGYNRIDRFPEQVFNKYCDTKNIRLSLDMNPIECHFNEIQWIFKYDSRKQQTFSLKNVNCLNIKLNPELLYLSESDFEHNTIPTIITSSIGSVSTKRPILPTIPSSPEAVTSKNITNDNTISLWHYILISISTIILLSIGLLIIYFYYKNNYSNVSKPPQLPKNTQNDFEIIFSINNLEGKYKNSFSEIEEIDTGSFGEVIKVKKISDKLLYAIKKIKITDVKVLKEVEIMSKLNSDFVVKYFDSWMESETRFKTITKFLFIQMELCSMNLRAFIKLINEINNENLKIFQYFNSCKIFRELIESLDYLHSLPKPIIHRDLKPENILICEGINGRVLKLCDFGLAKFHLISLHTRNVGTVAYIAPEVIESEKYNTKSDIYSLALIGTEIFQFNDKLIDIRKYKYLKDFDKHLSKYLNTILEKKFRKLIKLISNCLLPEDYHLRPDCRQILEKINSFSLEKSFVLNETNISDFKLFLGKPENLLLKRFFEIKK